MLTVRVQPGRRRAATQSAAIAAGGLRVEPQRIIRGLQSLGLAAHHVSHAHIDRLQRAEDSRGRNFSGAIEICARWTCRAPSECPR